MGIAPSFADALALLRVWANQRGFGAGFVPGRGKGRRNYCVRGFEGIGAWWACVLEVLILGEEPMEDAGGNKRRKRDQRPLVGKGLSSYQLFRAALDFLGESEPCIGEHILLRQHSARHDFEREAIFMKVVGHGQKVRLNRLGFHSAKVALVLTYRVEVAIRGCFRGWHWDGEHACWRTSLFPSVGNSPGTYILVICRLIVPTASLRCCKHPKIAK